jgi:hypothetical protein
MRKNNGIVEMANNDWFIRIVQFVPGAIVPLAKNVIAAHRAAYHRRILFVQRDAGLKISMHHNGMLQFDRKRQA